MNWRLRRWQLIILLGAFWARVWRLADLPPGIVRDETLNSDIARFIREGQHALFFREGFGHEPLYHYLSVPFAPLLGENVLAVRLPSVFLGMLLVAAVLRWVKRDFGAGASLMAGALVAFSWWGIIFSRVGLRPILLPLCLVGGVYFWQRRPVWAGVCLGLGVYGYTAGRVVWLWPLMVLVVAGGWWMVGRWFVGKEEGDRFDAKAQRCKGADEENTEARGHRGTERRGNGQLTIDNWQLAIRTAVVFVVSFLMYGPLWFVLWRDPSLQERVGQLRGPLDALLVGDVGPVWMNFWRTVGVFAFTGDPLWSYAVAGRPLFGWVVAFFFYVGAGVILWRLVRGAFLPLVLAGWFVVGIAPSVVADDAPSLVRLIGVLPLVYVLVAVGVMGVAQWLGRRGNGQLSTVNGQLSMGALVVPLGVLVVGLTVADTVGIGRVWVGEPAVREKYQSVWLDMARYYTANGGGDIVIADSWYEPVKADSFRLDVGVRPEARWVQNGGAIVLPAGGGDLYVPEFGPPHPVLFGLIGDELVYRSESYPSFAVYGLPEELKELREGEELVLGHLTGGEVALLGTVWGEDVGGRYLLSYWRVDGVLAADVSTFLHVLDGEGNLVRQVDGLDAAAGTLQVGDRFVQLHRLGEDLVGEQVVLGMYVRGSGERFLMGDGGDFVVVGVD